MQHASHLAALLCHLRQVGLAAFVDGQLVTAGGVAPASLRQNIAIGRYLVSLSSSAAGASAWTVSCATHCCLPPAAGAIRSSSWKSMPATSAVWPCIKNLVFLYGARPATTCYRGTAVSAHLVVRPLRCAYTATPL